MTPPLILLADDDALTRKAVQRLLTKRGYAAACVASGDDLLQALRGVTPGLIVLDWMMPDLDGLDLLRRLRADPATASLPILLYSAATEPDVEREAMRLGASTVVLKEGGFSPLCDRIEQCLAQTGQIAAA